jgi:conjugative relaxase-like TrwC/TraI family protein
MAKIRDGSTYLSHHLAANDYYCEQETISGQWQGRGAEMLSLNGDIHAGDTAFERLRNNRHPETGEKLTPRDGDGRVCFFDFQCSAQKSVSIMAVTMGDSRLIGAHDQAARIAFAELEQFAATQANSALTRNNRMTGNVVAAVFRHTASRALDPQVHTHHVIANATWDEKSNSWRALTEFEMVRAIRYAGKVYQNEMAKACLQLGYSIDIAQDDKGHTTGFEISGISAELRERFSKRRAEVEQGIEDFRQKHGCMPTTAEVHQITCDSRNAKLTEITTPEVIRAQRRQLSPAEVTTLEGLKTVAERRENAQPHEPGFARESECLRLAASHLYERKSVCAGHELLAEALNMGLGHIHLPDLKAKAETLG